VSDVKDRVLDLERRLMDALVSIERVRELHSPLEFRGGLYCAECQDGHGHAMPYPCATIEALDGAA